MVNYREEARKKKETIRRLQNSNKILRIQNQRLLAQNEAQHQVLQKAWDEAIPEVKNVINRKFIETQIRQIHKKSRGHRYGAEMKMLAISMQKKGPTQYLSLIHISEPTRPY